MPSWTHAGTFKKVVWEKCGVDNQHEGVDGPANMLTAPAETFAKVKNRNLRTGVPFCNHLPGLLTRFIASDEASGRRDHRDSELDIAVPFPDKKSRRGGEPSCLSYTEEHSGTRVLKLTSHC